jgi:hypothetical protein
MRRGFVCAPVLLAGVFATCLVLRPAGLAAQVAEETRQACTPDAMRLCSDFIPDVDKITACMSGKYAQLSSACRAAMSREEANRVSQARLAKSRRISRE